ncbi:MAG: peptidylprolyl isomerase [Sphingobium sp.]
MRPLRLVLILAMFAFATGVSQAQTPTAPPPSTPAGEEALKPRPATVLVTLVTSEGQIVLELEKERAPITTANFLRYVDGKRFDGQTFYRAINMAENFGLIQAGITKLKPGDKMPPPIAHEPTTQTGLRHQTGTVSMARGAPGSARWDFFITVGDMTSLDANPEQPGDNLGFAAFGHVVEGMDTVLKIMRSPISETLGVKDGL